MKTSERQGQCVANVHTVRLTPRVAQELSCGFDLPEGLLAKISTAAKRSRTIEVNELERMELEKATDFHLMYGVRGSLHEAFDKVWAQVR